MNALTTTATALPTAAAAQTALIDAFITRYAADLTPATVATYRRGASAFVSYLAARLDDIRDITEDDVAAYKSDLRARNLSNSTVNTYLAAARKLCHWMSRRHIIVEDVAADVENVRQEKGFKKDALSLVQVAALLAGIDRTTVEGLRDYALILTLLNLGLRTVEAARADIGDIRTVNGRATLAVWGKGRTGKDETMVLPTAVVNAINAYLAARGPAAESEPLFASGCHRNIGGRLSSVSISRIVKTALRRAGMDSSRLTAHSLRHTAVTMALLAGQTPQQAQTLARHANINTTMIYAHNIDRIRNAPEDAVAAYMAVAL